MSEKSAICSALLRSAPHNFPEHCSAAPHAPRVSIDTRRCGARSSGLAGVTSKIIDHVILLTRPYCGTCDRTCHLFRHARARSVQRQGPDVGTFHSRGSIEHPGAVAPSRDTIHRSNSCPPVRRSTVQAIFNRRKCAPPSMNNGEDRLHRAAMADAGSACAWRSSRSIRCA